jgi:PadR family transcriptional regulator PadR
MPALQHFELQVLLAMLRAGRETYSVPLVLLLEARLERPVAQAAVFIALNRLEKKGMVSSRMEVSDSGRPRRYFRVTKAGLQAVKAQHEEHTRLWRGFSRALKTRED